MSTEDPMTVTVRANDLRVHPLGGPFAAEVTGGDLNEATDENIEAIRRAIAEHLVVRLRGHRMDDVQFTRFVARFGELHTSPDYVKDRKVYVPESPLMSVVSNIVENGVAIGHHGDGELDWHTDLSFTDMPSALTMLCAREVPPTGGNTRFTDMYRAYDILPDELKARLARLTIKHQASHNPQYGTWPGWDHIETRDVREMPGPIHPIIRTHPETGRKSLYLGRRFGAYIPGLALAKSEALLDELWSYAGRDENSWAQEWQLHDVVIWDNRCTMHRRDSFAGLGRRRMHGLMTKGSRPE
jgi:taurine dioxygenase